MTLIIVISAVIVAAWLGSCVYLLRVYIRALSRIDPRE